jgi:hypothetical protein
MKLVLAFCVLVLSTSVFSSVTICTFKSPSGRAADAHLQICGATKVSNELVDVDEMNSRLALVNSRMDQIENAQEENLKETKSHEVRIQKNEEVLQQDIIIPESVKSELRKEIIEELKQQFNLTPKN